MKIKQTFFVLLAIGAAFTLTNCEKDSTGSGGSNSKALSKLSGTIQSEQSLEGKTIQLFNVWGDETVWAEGTVGSGNTFTIDLKNLTVGETKENTEIARELFIFAPDPSVGKDARLQILSLKIKDGPYVDAETEEDNQETLKLIYSDREYKLTKDGTIVYKIRLTEGVNMISYRIEGDPESPSAKGIWESHSSLPGAWFWTTD